MTLADHPVRAQIATTPPDPARIDADVRGALVNRIDTARRGVGIVVGVLTSGGRRYLAHGRTANENGTEPTQDTVFEIGSITKVFTALLLADMVERGEMQLDDPIQKYLPGVVVPTRDGKSITLVDLATHTSGLPRLPANMPFGNPADPYADYTGALLEQFLGSYQLPRAPGEQWDYSNLGVGLLGHILSRHAGRPFEELLRTRIFQPLGMRDTSITLRDDQRRRMATGYNEGMAPVTPWQFDALAGAGAIRSTAADMLTFAAAHLELIEHPLLPAMRRMQSVARPGGAPGLRQMIGWVEIRGTVLFHDGGTSGQRSAIALRPGTKHAAVVLSNMATDVGDIALHAVVPEQPLRVFEPPKARVAIELGAEVLQTYVGTYRLAPGSDVAITREGTRLFAQATGNPRTELKAEREGEFFDVNNPVASISFTKDAAGAVVGLVLQLPGMTLPGPRVQ